MNAYEQAPEELKFIVRNLEEWPSDVVDRVYILYGDSEICFLGVDHEDFDFKAKENVSYESIGLRSGIHTREQYETAREAYVKMNYKPIVGDLVDVVFNNGSKVEGANIKFVGDHILVYVLDGNKEDTAYISNVIINKHTPEPTTQDLMLEDWRKSSLDNAHDTMSSGVYLGDVLDVLASNGWVKAS